MLPRKELRRFPTWACACLLLSQQSAGPWRRPRTPLDLFAMPPCTSPPRIEIRMHPRPVARALQQTDGAVLTVGAMVTAVVSILVGHALKLDASARLFVITFLLVIFGADRGSGELACLLACTWRGRPGVERPEKDGQCSSACRTWFPRLAAGQAGRLSAARFRRRHPSAPLITPHHPAPQMPRIWPGTGCVEFCRGWCSSSSCPSSSSPNQRAWSALTSAACGEFGEGGVHRRGALQPSELGGRHPPHKLPLHAAWKRRCRVCTS